MSDRAAAFRVLLRKDLASFTHKTFLTVSPAREYQLNWHIETMARNL